MTSLSTEQCKDTAFRSNEHGLVVSCLVRERAPLNSPKLLDGSRGARTACALPCVSRGLAAAFFRSTTSEHTPLLSENMTELQSKTTGTRGHGTVDENGILWKTTRQSPIGSFLQTPTAAPAVT